MEKAPLGLALARLERAGWIKREPDPSDRRARRVYLLEKADASPALRLIEEAQWQSRPVRIYSLIR